MRTAILTFAAAILLTAPAFAQQWGNVKGQVMWGEAAIPEPPSIRAFIEAHKPDVMLLTPLIDLGSSQVEYLRAARAIGIPTGLCVWSWDHLSSKALIRECVTTASPSAGASSSRKSAPQVPSTTAPLRAAAAKIGEFSTRPPGGKAIRTDTIYPLSPVLT